MPRPKENVHARLKEQMDFLLTSLRAFYDGNFAESVRIATAIRVLVHESGRSKPLLTQAQPNGLDLPILEHVGEWPAQVEIFSFAVSIRLGCSPIHLCPSRSRKLEPRLQIWRGFSLRSPALKCWNV